MISVLLAAYRGEKYISEQIASILPQLEDGDELLVSDDSPEGDFGTRDIVLSFHDPRVSYMAGPRQGVIKNVAFLLGQARGDILVLCDQDDVWLPDKLARTREAFDPANWFRMSDDGEISDTPEKKLGYVLAFHDAKIVDENLCETGQTLFQLRGMRTGWQSLLKNSYTGCCMAFTRELLPVILPFPEGIPMHDQWIGLRAEKHGGINFTCEPLILWRRHGDAQTGQGGSLKQKIMWRYRMARALWG